MCVSLWEAAQGKTPFCDDVKRCDVCGRRVNFDNCANVFIGESSAKQIIIRRICNYHGGQHDDCLTGVQADFGKGKSWFLIFISNVIGESVFWIKAVFVFVHSCVSLFLNVLLHPVKYYRARKELIERGWSQ